ncbi:MAG TPA: tetratricopeptide repeat protein [Steroidobacteraceae bacterium]
MTADRKRTIAAAIVLMCTARHVVDAQKSQSTGSNRLADSLYAAGDASAAARQYRAVLSTEPNNARALYMLAKMLVDSPREAVSLLERYTALVPTDAWGFIALGTARGRTGDVPGALKAFDAAERLAPNEGDVHIGRARMLAAARHTDAAIAAYVRWTSTHSKDDAAQRELAAQYRRAGRPNAAIAALERAQQVAPDERTKGQLLALRAQTALRVEPQASGSRDSDGMSVTSAGANAGIVAGEGVGLTIGGGVRRTSDGVRSTRLTEARAGVTWAPTAMTRVDLQGGFLVAPGDTTTVLVPPPGRGQGQGQGRPPLLVIGSGSTGLFPAARLRYQWRDVGGRARLDLRATQALLDASPVLVHNQVQRSELGAEGDLPVAGPIAIRGLARIASIRSVVDDNSRAMFGARLVGKFRDGSEITFGGQQFTYAHASATGYFAPQQARTLEVGAYREGETERGVTFALDLGAGGQQVTEWGTPASAWAPAFRGWASLGIPLAPGRELRFEAEAYDARIGSELATGGERWRYGSGAVSLRWAF